MQEIGDRYTKGYKCYREKLLFENQSRFFEKKFFLCPICQFFYSFFGRFAELKKLS